jgi:hypothetical protein
MPNTIKFTVEVDPQGRLKSQVDGVIREIGRVDTATTRIAQNGTSLANIFKGNLLANFFQQGANAAVDFGVEVVRVAARASDANRVLQASAIEAGIAYQKASGFVDDFARRAALSEQAAQRTFSGILAFSRAAGQTNKVQEFTKAFTDLAAARGIPAGNLGDIAKQLSTLQDEATDKLLQANPSAFYDALATSLGKTADSLTDAEKRAAVFNAVLEKGTQFAGEAEKRLQGVAGQLDVASARWEDFKTKAGEAIIGSGGVNLLLQTTIDLLDNVAKPRKISIVAGKGATTPAQALKDQDAEQNSLLRITDAIVAAFRSDVTFQDINQSRLTLLANDIFKDVTKEFQDQAAAAFRSATDPGPLGKASFENGRSFGADPVSTLLKTGEAAQKALEPIRNMRNELSTVFFEMGAKVASDNPYVTLFNNAEKALDSFRKSFGELGPEVEKQFTSLLQQSTGLQLLEERFNTRLNALKFRQEADELRGQGQSDTSLGKLSTFDEKLTSFVKFQQGFTNSGLTRRNTVFTINGAPTGQQIRNITSLEQNQESLGHRFFGDPAGLFHSDGASSLSQHDKIRQQLSLVDKLRTEGADLVGSASLADRLTLQLTQGLDATAPQDIRAGRIGALERSATREEQKEREAAELTREVRTFIKNADVYLRTMAQRAGIAPQEVEVLIQDDRSTTAVRKLLGQTPTGEVKR